MSPAFIDDADADHSHLGHALPDNGDVCAADELIASEFVGVNTGFNPRSLLKRQ
jgi:hypothetical protein